MSHSEKPIIAVCGATGAQGGSVVAYLLNDPDHSFRVRGLTRKVDSPKAKELASHGVEVVKADLNDIKSLKKAFEGAYGVFGVTNFWEVMSGEAEIQQGRNVIDAAAAVGVKHFVWSTVDHTANPNVPHWDSKATIDDYLKDKGLPRTSLYTSFYYENFLTTPSFHLKKDPDGHLVADWPALASDGPIGGFSVAETGAYILEAFKKPQEWIGKDMRVISDVFTPRLFVKALSEVLGKEIKLKEIDFQTFNQLKSANYELWAKHTSQRSTCLVPKQTLILSRVAPEKKIKKRKTDTATSGPSHGFGIIDDDGGWGEAAKGPEEDADDADEAVVASDRSFKKRRVAEGEEGSGWAVVQEGISKEESPPPDERPQVVDTLFAGGLVKASELKKRLPGQNSKSKRTEADCAREREEARLAQGTAETGTRGKKEAQKMEWGKGLVQREDAAKRTEQLEKERNRDLAVYVDDTELNEEQKAAMRWNGPAAQFLTKKSKKGPRRPEYSGPPPPPNRFGIKPGYRWDGVDRSNGFEKKYFQKLNERKRRGMESYQWSVDDM